MTEVPPEEEAGESGGSPHTTPEEGHPAGEGPRSDRDIGGPTSPEEEDGDATGGAHGTREGEFKPHE